jgi:hypothetical protein
MPPTSMMPKIAASKIAVRTTAVRASLFAATTARPILA